jgi:hypothetical protein
VNGAWLFEFVDLLFAVFNFQILHEDDCSKFQVTTCLASCVLGFHVGL